MDQDWEYFEKKEDEQPEDVHDRVVWLFDGVNPEEM